MSQPAWSQDDTPPPAAPGPFSGIPLGVGPQMFFDAETTEFTRDGLQQVFRGDVVAVGGGVMITADRISLHRGRNVLTADGHVVILTETQVYLGDKITYHILSGDFLLVNSMMIANDKKKAKELSHKLLGFTPAELAFAKQRSERLEVIEERKAALRERYLLESGGSEEEPSHELVDRYSLLLEQEDLTRDQVNPFLAKMAKDRRERFKARRYHWKKGLKDAKALKRKQRVTAFFRIDGKTIKRRNDNDYEAEDAFWTPCKCEDDENPAWGFRASKIEGQMEGYLDFYHPVLEIKGVPVLYLPYLKVPVKERRQSGFLMPTFASRSDAGNIYSQPVYFALGDNYDATLTPEFYEKRGTKVATEFRVQQKKYSGWTLKLEGMRDRVWLADRKRRDEARDHYFSDNNQNIEAHCEAKLGNDRDDPNAMAQCIRAAKNRLALPDNTWRHAQIWRGLTILAPRLSVVSHGKLYSDHRYVEDLTLYEDFQSGSDAAKRATFFSPSKYQAHLDGKNFYLGAGGSYGDNVLTNERFQGQQLPLKTSLQSRFYSLDRGYLPLPIYAKIGAEHKQIADFVGTVEDDDEDVGENRTLGSGYWQRVKFDQVSPIVSNWIVKVDQFFDWEARSIAHSGLEETHSTIESWRTGLTFNLPIDGDAKLPQAFQGGEGSFGTGYVRHYMNWAVKFSVRPEAKRTGPYGKYKNLLLDQSDDRYKEGGELVYFATDRRTYDTKSDVRREDSMFKHKQIAFSTDHTWDIFERGWEVDPARARPKDETTEKLSYYERAKQELLYNTDLPIEDFRDMMDESGKWYINRYKLLEKNKSRVVTWNANINYDFVQAEEREREKDRRRRGEVEDTGQPTLPRPWSNPKSSLSLRLFSTTVRNQIEYDIYLKLVTEQRFNLIFPTFLGTTLQLGYVIGDEVEVDEDNNLQSSRTTTSSANIVTKVIPNFTIGYDYALRNRREFDGTQAEPEYETELDVAYVSPSDCWKLAFRRRKIFGGEERDAAYFLGLSIIMMGRERPTQDLSTGIIRELPDRDDGN